jgi:hypothetical protein
MLVLVATAGAAVSNALFTPASDMESKAWAGWDEGRARSKRPTAAANEGVATPALRFFLLMAPFEAALAGLPTVFISTPPQTCILIHVPEHVTPGTR